MERSSPEAYCITNYSTDLQNTVGMFFSQHDLTPPYITPKYIDTPDPHVVTKIFADPNECGLTLPVTYPVCNEEESFRLKESRIDVNTLKIYPNPTKNLLFIESKKINISVKIFNLVGEIMYNQKIDNKLFQINVENFTSGMYFIKIDNANVYKFIKQ